MFDDNDIPILFRHRTRDTLPFNIIMRQVWNWIVVVHDHLFVY